MIEDLQIRPMQMEDIEQVRVIDRQSFPLPWPEHAYHFELTQNPNSRLWVVTLPGPDGAPKVVGMVVVWMIVDEAHIATLAVHPDYRRRGIGRELLVHTLKEALREGARTSMLEVRAGNWVAQNLYRKFSFREVGRRRRYYQDNQEDAVLMNADLVWIEKQGLIDR